MLAYGSGTENTTEFLKVCNTLQELYQKKNADYGGSFTTARDILGANVIAVHLVEKSLRMATLTKQAAQVDESIEDTLKDIANFCIMELMARCTSQ